MIDMEQVRERVIEALSQGIGPQLLAVDNTKPGVVTTPEPAVYIDYPILDESMVVWPVCLVMPRRAARTDTAAQGYATRRYELDIEVHFADSDQAVLGVWVERTVAAGSAVLEQQAIWDDLGLYNPRVNDALFSDVLPSEDQFLRACRLVFQVEGIDATEE